MTRNFCALALSLLLALPLVGCGGSKTKDQKELEFRKRVAEAEARRHGGGNLRNPDMMLPNGGPIGTQSSYSRVSVNGPYIAMTFDDGPHPTHTPRLLDMLKQRNIKATFYVIGNSAKRHPEILRRMIREGHEIGNHTMTHAYLTKLSDASIRRELKTAHQAIFAATGVHPRTVRPPYGATNSRIKTLMYKEFRYPSIMWSVDPEDWKRPGSSVVANRLIRGADNGGILLAHDIHAPTIQAMPAALDGLLRKGYRFVTVSQLISLERGNQNLASSYSAGAW